MESVSGRIRQKTLDVLVKDVPHLVAMPNPVEIGARIELENPVPGLEKLSCCVVDLQGNTRL